MRTEEFRVLTEKIDELTTHQRRQLTECIRNIDRRHEVHFLIENNVLNSLLCPKCGQDQIAYWGYASGLQRYRCSTCKVTFNALTGTPLARLRHKDKWLDYAEQLTEGKSIRKSAEICGVHRNTSFRWRHRFLTNLNANKAMNLVGIVEADETFFLESFKGKKQGMKRAARKRGGKASKRGLSAEQIPVLICRDRSGSTADFVLEKDDKIHISAAFKPILAADSILCTDSGKALGAAAREIGIAHRPVNLAAGIRVIAKIYHVQNVNAYGSRLKTWIRRFHGVATRYLPNYLSWRRLIDSRNETISPKKFLCAALGVKYDQQLMVT